MKGQAEESGSGKTNRVVRDVITTYLLECADLHTYDLNIAEDVWQFGLKCTHTHHDHAGFWSCDLLQDYLQSLR